MVNQFYVYCVDSDFGPSFLKFSSYFPYTAKLCINGHEYAKQQLVQKGIGFQAHSLSLPTAWFPRCMWTTRARVSSSITKKAAPYAQKPPLFAVLVVFSLQLHGFTNSQLRPLLAQLLGLDPANYPIGRMTGVGEQRNRKLA